MSGFVSVSLDIRYPNFETLRSFLDAMFGRNYQLTFRNEKITLRTPRYLTDGEKSALEEANNHFYYEQENEAIRAQIKHQARADPSLPSQSSPALTRNLPIAQPDLAATHPAKTSSADETNNKEAVKPPASTSTIPLFQSESWKIVQGFGKVVFEFERSETHEGDMDKTGFYASRLEDGETSSVFDMKGHMIWSVGRHNPLQKDGVVTKVAVKRLHEHTPPERFWDEYHSLKLLKSMDHPHIVEMLAGFRYEENGVQHFNFMFPLAFGNLKRLIRGSYDKNPTFQRRVQNSLWDQFVGLSSAVAYLHDSIQIAHRDIKPSNILIYEEPASGGLILKLTDFGLAVDLTKAETWEDGTLALQSAWLYDSPESQRESPNIGSEPPIAKKIRIPSATGLLANDIWKLGSVFTEMVAFLVGGGSTGVDKFRDYITTTESTVESDLIYDTSFHDGFKVKAKVLEWLDRMARGDTRARQLQPILGRMLAKSADRPTIKEVCEELVKIDFPNIRYDDGLRMATFIPADQASPHSRTEGLQLGIEEWIGRQVDWWPLPTPRPKLRPNQCLMTWEWQGIELCMSLSQDELDRYKPMCLPRTTRNTPILPIVNQPPGSSTQTSTNIPLNSISQPGAINNQNTPGNVALGGAVQSPTVQQSSGPSRDMYWCIEKIFTEPTENHLFSILHSSSVLHSEGLKDDEDLYNQVNTAIRSARCWIWWLFSWKRCTEVEFIEFCVVRRDGSEVDPMKTGLLPPVTARGYTHAVPFPYDVQMRAAAKQMVCGLMYPSKGKGDKTIISMLPRKLNPPPLPKEMGQVGWGLHAKMGFSQWRFVYWLIFSFVLNAVFVAAWLGSVDPKDLQNAFVPAAVTTAALAIALAVVQREESRDSR